MSVSARGADFETCRGQAGPTGVEAVFEARGQACDPFVLEAVRQSKAQELMTALREEDRTQALTLIDELNRNLQTTVRCEPSRSCSELIGALPEKRFAGEWRGFERLETMGSGEACQLSSAEIRFLGPNGAEIIAAGSLDKLARKNKNLNALRYQFKKSPCAADGSVLRHFIWSASGFTVVDEADGKTWLGKMFLTRARFAPQLQFQESGNVRIELARGAYFEFSPSQRTVVQSNVLDPSNFVPGTCRSRIGRAILPELVFAQGSERFLSRMEVVGDEKSIPEENKINAWIRSLPQEYPLASQ